MATEQGSGQRPEDLTDDDILSLPLDSAPGSILTEIWARHATVQSTRNFAQFNRELDDAYAGPRRFTSQAAVDRKHAAERDERQILYARAYQQFQETMQDIRDRTDDLLRRIDEQEEVARERLAAIRKRAIVLSDGRRVYVGDHGDYLDEDGQTLAGQDDADARLGHAAHPEAPTWKEKVEAQRRYDEALKMHEDVTRFRDRIGSEDGQGLSGEQLKDLAERNAARLEGYEAAFKRTVDARAATMEHLPTNYGNADYMALATSYASKLDPKGPGLKADFAPAAQRQSSPEPPIPASAVTAPRRSL